MSSIHTLFTLQLSFLFLFFPVLSLPPYSIFLSLYTHLFSLSYFLMTVLIFYLSCFQPILLLMPLFLPMSCPVVWFPLYSISSLLCSCSFVSYTVVSHTTVTVRLFYFSFLALSCNVWSSLYHIILTSRCISCSTHILFYCVAYLSFLSFSSVLVSHSVLSSLFSLFLYYLLTCPLQTCHALSIPYSSHCTHFLSLKLTPFLILTSPHSSNYHIPTRSKSNKTIDTDDVWVEWYASGVKERRKGRERV